MTPPPDWTSPVADYRNAIRHQEKRRLHPSRQQELQAEAVRRHERETAQREAYLDSLIIEPSAAASSPSPQSRIAKFSEKPKSKPRVSRVAAVRVLNKPATQPKENP